MKKHSMVKFSLFFVTLFIANVSFGMDNVEKHQELFNQFVLSTYAFKTFQANLPTKENSEDVPLASKDFYKPACESSLETENLFPALTNLMEVWSPENTPTVDPTYALNNLIISTNLEKLKQDTHETSSDTKKISTKKSLTEKETTVSKKPSGIRKNKRTEKNTLKTYRRFNGRLPFSYSKLEQKDETNSQKIN